MDCDVEFPTATLWNIIEFFEFILLNGFTCTPQGKNRNFKGLI